MASRIEHDHSSLDTARADTSFFGHPRGLATLFFTEMWERFSYYGMRAILILFMTHKIAEGGLGFGDDKAGAIYGLYTAMVYLLCLGGGCVESQAARRRRRDQIQDQEGAHPVVAEALPHLGEEERGEPTGVAGPASRVGRGRQRVGRHRGA